MWGEEKKTVSKSLKTQAKQILKEAEKRGVSSNYFFATTFKRYQVQLAIMDSLEQTINELGNLVTKEYVKGRENLTANPAIAEYNRTATAANSTVSTLISIMEKLTEDAREGGKLNELIASLNDE